MPSTMDIPCLCSGESLRRSTSESTFASCQRSSPRPRAVPYFVRCGAHCEPENLTRKTCHLRCDRLAGDARYAYTRAGTEEADRETLHGRSSARVLGISKRRTCPARKARFFAEDS